MIVQTDSQIPSWEIPRGASGVQVGALSSLARAVAAAAQAPELTGALVELAEAARAISGAELALVRMRVAGGDRFEAVAVAGPATLAAELEGTFVPAAEMPTGALDLLDTAPEAVRKAAERAGARSILLVPVHADGTAATIELYRAGGTFTEEERLGVELAVAYAALVLRAFAGSAGRAIESLARPALELAGEALAAALDESHTADELVRVAATIVGAPVGLLWERGDDGVLQLAASYGLERGVDLAPARELASTTLDEPGPVRPVAAEGLPASCGISTTLPLGQPAVGLLQLLFAPADAPDVEQLARLTTFGVRVAHALRSSARARTLGVELDRTRALLAVVGQATAQLSLAHTLETAVERLGELFAVEHVAVYLRAGEDRLTPAAGRGLAGPHARVAERLLEIALGTSRGRPVVEVTDAWHDRRLREARDAARESGIDAALAVPLMVRDEVIGLLAVYPQRGRRPTENEATLLAALAGQLAVAVQNAQLHEDIADKITQRETALASERAAAKRLKALYEISQSFAQSLSLDTTLDALAETAVDVLDVDAAVLRMPDARRELLLPRAMHVKDDLLASAARTILFRSQPFGAASTQHLFRDAKPYRVGKDHDLLGPFLEKGWTGAVIPVGTPAEVIASLSIFSFRPGSPITAETIDAALAIAGHAALAIDNARLYQQQKEFADTMQRSLLPRAQPDVAGLDVGEVYESSARVDVGGDVYDFMTLDDGRLAVVLGDVTGHGVEATADMAMAKFVFRSLAREHPEPGDFLAHANDVVVDEIAPGKFITMAYLAVDGVNGTVSCASAGHPAPRLVLPDGTVHGLEASGLVLGIDAKQTYEAVQDELPLGAVLVVYTDGVIEARRDGELYGVERLDALLAEHRDLAPRDLAVAVTESCRSFAGGELGDDVAVVVIRRVP
jgi:serine phosphatase RsbU (regulator of sigma subunit)